MAGALAVLWFLLYPTLRRVATLPIDDIPASAAAFLSVRPGDPAVQSLLTTVVSAFAGLPADVPARAPRVTYVVLSRDSSVDVPALILHGRRGIDLTSAPSLTVTTWKDNAIVTRKEFLGDVSALSRETWGSDRAVRRAVREVGNNAPLLVGLRPSAAEIIFRELSFPASPAFHASLVLAGVQQRADRLALTARVAHERAEPDRQQPAGVQADLEHSAGTLPSATRFVRSLSAATLRKVLERADGPPALAGTLSALRELASTLRDLLALVRGPVVFGILPTSVSGVRDAVAIVPLTVGADPTPLLQKLEPAALSFGPALTRAPYANPIFESMEYRGVRVRYMNFGAPARAVDYAVSEDLLLLSTSRGSMFALIDGVKDPASSLRSRGDLAQLRDLKEARDFLLIIPDEGFRQALPTAYTPLIGRVRGLHVSLGPAGRWSGTLLLH